jgi:signal transduction histidine kinase
VSTPLRSSGIDVVGDLPWGTHFFLFYETTNDLFDAVVPYLKAGLEAGDYCMWVISDPLTEGDVKIELRRSVAGFDNHLRRGSIEILRGREWYMTGKELDPGKVLRAWKEKIGSALSRGYSGLRLSGDTAWLDNKDWQKFHEYEEDVDQIIAGEPMIALCTYPLAGSKASELLDVARTHQFAIARRKNQWEIVETAELKQAKRQIQKLNNELEQRVSERTRELVIANEELRQEMKERQRAEEALQSAQAQLNASLKDLRALNARLVSIREEERNLVSREIHDELGQALTAIKLEFTALLRDLPVHEGPVSRRSQSILKLLDQTIQSVRRIATGLRPTILDDLGLVAALEWAAEDFQTRTGTSCQIDLPDMDIELAPERATALFRIFQETLTNVARHAHATHVSARLAEEDGSLILEVRDNGIGIRNEQLSAPASLGILGLRERVLLVGGTLTIKGTPGKGTIVRVLIPDFKQAGE